VQWTFPIIFSPVDPRILHGDAACEEHG
jgi:hypothetical protein